MRNFAASLLLSASIASAVYADRTRNFTPHNLNRAPSALPEDGSHGRRQYEKYCADCHTVGKRGYTIIIRQTSGNTVRTREYNYNTGQTPASYAYCR